MLTMNCENLKSQNVKLNLWAKVYTEVHETGPRGGGTVAQVKVCRVNAMKGDRVWVPVINSKYGLKGF